MLTAASDDRIVDKIVFGPSQRLEGVYFTNFENSKFVACHVEAECQNWTRRQDAWVHCDPEACRAIEEAVVKQNGSHNREGLFEIRFTGRKAKATRPKAFLNDSEDDVLVEKLEALTLLPDQ